MIGISSSGLNSLSSNLNCSKEKLLILSSFSIFLTSFLTGSENSSANTNNPISKTMGIKIIVNLISRDFFHYL